MTKHVIRACTGEKFTFDISRAQFDAEAYLYLDGVTTNNGYATLNLDLNALQRLAKYIETTIRWREKHFPDTETQVRRNYRQLFKAHQKRAR